MNIIKRSAFIVILTTGLTVIAQLQSGLAAEIFSFIVVGCPHLDQNREGEPTGIEKFEILLKQVDSLQEKPDLMLIAGDIHINGFKKVFPKIKQQVLVTFGNHESMNAREEFKKIFPEIFNGKDYYSFKHKNCLFIQICDSVYRDHLGHLSSQFITPGQKEWLEKQLSENFNKVDHIFIFGHIPPSPSEKVVEIEEWLGHPMFLSVNDRRYLSDLVMKYRPTALFFGHLHKRLEFKIGDSDVVVVGSGNWHFGKNRPIGFMKVKVFTDKIEKEFIPLEIEKIR